MLDGLQVRVISWALHVEGNSVMNEQKDMPQVREYS